MKKHEYVLCAANHYDDGIEHKVNQPDNIKTGFVVCGHRHSDCISTFALMVGFPYDQNGLKLMQTEEQGFLTSTNRWVDRKEAAEIAVKSNQVKQEDLNSRLGLFSENLY